MRLPFDPPPGLLSDDTKAAASGRWADMSNMRFWKGKAQVIGGWERMVQDALTGVCRGVHAWTTTAGVLTAAFGTHSALQVWQDGQLFTVTPAGLAAGMVDGTGGQGFGTGSYSVGNWSEPSLSDYFPRTWSLGNFGEVLIANPRRGGIYEWTGNTANPATLLTNAPATVTACLVTPKDQVMALGCNEEVSGVFNPVCIRYSSVRKRTEWNTGNATTAREYVLPGGGEIVSGRVMGDYVLVWTRDGLFLGTFSSNLAQPWSFKRVPGKGGLLGPNAVAVIGQQAYWLGPDLQFYAYALGGPVVGVPCTIRDDLDANLAPSQRDKVFASVCSMYGEVRWDYPDARDGVENSRYVVYSTVGDTWSRGIMARTAMLDTGPAVSPIGVTPDGAAYWHERGKSADGAPFAWFIESADLELDGQRSVMCRAFYPDFKDQVGPASVTVTTRQQPQGNPRTYPAFTVAAGQAKADFRGSGRSFRLRFSGNSSPAALRFGKPYFDAVQTGGR